MNHPIPTAIAGLGKSGQNIHAPLIRAGSRFELKAVFSRSATEVPGATIYRDFESLLGNDDIRLVIITTPNHLHFEMAEQALRAGKHVVVDKPFTVTSDEADLLINLAKQQNRVLTVFQNRRFDGDFLTVKNLIGDHAVGRLVEFEATFNRFRPELKADAWKEKNLPGSGILYDLGPHLMDQAIQLFGNPVALHADIRAQRGGETDDSFELNFNYPDFKVKLRAGMLTADETPRFILRGDEGAFVKYGMDPQEQALADGVNPASASFGKEDKSRFGTLIQVENGMKSSHKIETIAGNYQEFYRNVAASIDGTEPLNVSPEEARNVIWLIECALKSSREKRVVRLDEVSPG